MQMAHMSSFPIDSKMDGSMADDVAKSGDAVAVSVDAAADRFRGERVGGDSRKASAADRFQ